MKLASTKKNFPGFTYDSPLWGIGAVPRNEKSVRGRKLDYCLEALEGLQGRVLEVGCARGQFIRSIKKHNPNLQAYGSDINAVAIRLNQEEVDGVNYCVGDALHLPFQDSFFDAVVMFDLLEHLDKPQLFVHEISRVLKKGGILHGYIPCEGEPLTLHWLLWKIRLGHNLKKKHRGHIQRFNINGCVDLFKVSFAIQNVRYSGYWLEQILDILFYISLEFGKMRESIWDVHASSDSEVNHKSFSAAILNVMKNFAFQIGYFETRFLSTFLKKNAALGLHVTAIK